MLFTSPVFLFIYLPLFLFLYFLVPNKYRNYVILTFSVMFYLWGEPKFTFIVLISIIIDYYLVNLMSIQKKDVTKKIILTISIVINVFMLGYFKYSNFFIENINYLFTNMGIKNIQWTNIALPIGVSFIVFEKVTYSVDVYRSIGKPAKSLQEYMIYILLFPKLLAGPIVKYHDIEKQLENRTVNFENILYGTFRFSLGLAKKVLIADTLSVFADKAFSEPIQYLNFSNAWLGILCFTFQVYFDFSAYSDMAIALARIMGFKLNENFNMPYISTSFTDFWRRWHISLSTWIKEYLYIPLGGNRCSKARNYFNLCFSFFISGLWHGANWTFIIWGLYHGFFLVIDKIFWLKTSKKIPNIINTVLTFIFVLIGWVFFRANTLTQSIQYLGRMFSFNFAVKDSLIINNSTLVTLISAFIICIIPITKLYKSLLSRFNEENIILKREGLIMPLSIILFVISIIKISGSQFNPFLYFRF